MLEPGTKLGSFPQALTQVREENDLELQKDDLDEEINIEDEIKNTAKFESLIDLVNTNFSEAQGCVQELLQLKDELLMNYLPPPLLFRIAVVFGNLYRTFSDLNTPVNEMLRLVTIFSASWEKNNQLLKNITDLHENKKQLLNNAIKRLANVDKKTKLFAKEKRVQNWEKLFIKLNEAKGHGRRWKFRMEAFRNKSNSGYTELVKWVMAKPPDDNSGEPESLIPKRKSVRHQRDRRRKSKDMREHRKQRELTFEKDDLDTDDDKLSLNTRSQFDDDDESDRKNGDSNYIEVDDDQDIFSESSSEQGSSKKKEKTVVFAPKVETSESTTQTQANVQEKTVWTGEPNYTRYFIVRVFKPQEHENKHLKFEISFNGDNYTSKNFSVKKIEKKVKIVDKPRKVRRNLSRDTKDSTSENDSTDYKIDMNKYEDFLFELDDNFGQKSKSFLTTSQDNSIKFEMTFDEKENTVPCFASLNMDDIHTLDLPILYYKTTDEVQEATFYDKSGNVKRLDRENSISWLRPNDLTEDANKDYGVLSKRSPFFFNMYNTRQTVKTKESDSVCKLPLMFFWIRKPSSLKLDKCTGSETLKDIVEDYTGFDITQMDREEIQKQVQKPEVKETVEIACSPMPIEEEKVEEEEDIPEEIEKERPQSTPTVAMTPKQYDVIEVKQDLNEEIATMQETYQLKIDELNLTIYKLENEITQLRTINERSAAEQNRAQKFKNIKNNTSNQSKPPPEKAPKTVKSPEPNQSTYDQPHPPKKLANNVPKSTQPKPPPIRLPKPPTATTNEFFERLNYYNEESAKHHKELYTKYIEEEAYVREQQMVVQHRLDTRQRNQNNKLDDFCLPAVFMPFKSGNSVYNPRAHKYFHPSGSNDVRLTQAPAIFQLPALPAKTSISVINLFDLGRRYQQGEHDYYINDYINRHYMNTEQSTTNKIPESRHNMTGNTETNLCLGNMLNGDPVESTTVEENLEPASDRTNGEKIPFHHDSSRSRLNIDLNNFNS